MDWRTRTSIIVRLVFGFIAFLGTSQAAQAGITAYIGSSHVYYNEPGQLTIGVSATDNSGTINKIEIYQNGVLIATRTNSSFFNYTVSNLPAGFYTFYSIVYDQTSSVTTSNLGMRVNAAIACTVPNGTGQQQPDGSCKVMSCNTGYHNENNSCMSNTQACTIANGTGQQTWNGTGYNACQVVSCNASFHNENNACVSNTQACTVPNGSGQQSWNGSGYDACQVTACNTNYHNENNVCVGNTQACTIANGTGQQTWNGTDYGTCQVVSCNDTFHNENNSCMPNIQSCSITNGTGQQSWNGTGYDTCQVVSCNTSYHNENNSCMSNTQACTVPNGSGQQTWNGSGYDTCQVTACNAGYLNKYNTCVARAAVPGAGDISSVPIPTSVAGITVWSEQGAGTGTTYYVSPNGNDANDGLSPSTAWQTLTKVAATTFQAGDSVLLEGGQNFTGCITFNSTKIKSTSAQPFTLGSYGTGRFTLTASCTSTTRVAAIRISGINGFILRDAIIRGNNGGAQIGVWIENQGSTVTDGVSVKNSDISGFWAAGAYFGGEIFITGYPGAGLNHINIVNNELHGASPSSFDDNGVSGFGGGMNITNILYQGNLIYNIGGRANGGGGVIGSGIEANGVGSGVIQYNIAHDLGGNTNTCGGPSGFWAVNAKNVTIQHNEAYRVQPLTFTAGCDWDGYDLDIGVTNSVVQYNYSHDNFGAGYLVFVSGTWGNNVYRNNISVNDALIGTSFWGGITTNNNGSTARVDIYNNTVYNTGVGARSNQSTPMALNTATMTGTIANNIFYSSVNFGGKSWVFNTNNHKATAMTILNNDYYGSLPIMMEWGNVRYYTLATWQAASGQDPQALSVNPAFNTSTQGVTYQLSPTSPLLGNGVDFTRTPYNMSVGTEDYFGNPIPHAVGTGYNIGADGGNGY